MVLFSPRHRSNAEETTVTTEKRAGISPQSPKLPSEARFGATMAGVLAVFAFYSLYRHASLPTIIGLSGAAGAFLTVTLVAPSALRPLNQGWFKLGLILGKVVSPVVIGVIYCVMIAPVGIVMRICRRDALNLRRHDQGSYWIDRSGAEHSSFKNQF